MKKSVDEFFEIFIEAKNGNQNAMEKMIEQYLPLIITYSKNSDGGLNEDYRQLLTIQVINIIRRFELLS